MFKNQFINTTQTFNDSGVLRFDPDSSPAAWAHYQQFYLQNLYLRKNYDFVKLCFYNYYDTVGLKTGYFDGEKWFNYVNKPIKKTTDYNRLFILQKGTQTDSLDNTEFIVATNRLGGDCDFNFNEKKCEIFVDLIKTDTTISENEKQEVYIRLERCRNMHHSLLNFSLIQAMGNLQKFKGSNRFDRLDTFICELDKYYRGVSNSVLRFATPNNEPALISFLNDFKDIYEYCSTFYFISDKHFIDEIIRQGSMPIAKVDELIRYLDLAETYWSKKEFFFLKNEFLTIGDYFQNGGESYSRSELITKIENDLGYSKEESDELINKCEERGFLTSVGNVLTH